MTLYRFGPGLRWALDARSRQATADGQLLALSTAAMDLLLDLAARAGQWLPAAPQPLRELVALFGTGAVLDAGQGCCRLVVPPVVPQAARTGAEPGGAPEGQPPTMIGRGDDLRLLDEQLQRGRRQITVLGVSGMGKSLLACHLAHTLRARWPDGAVVVPLGNLPAGSSPVGAVGVALGLPAGGPDPLGTLARAAAHLSMLLVLDGVEHLAEPVGQLVHALLQAAPGLAVVATSQIPLRTPDELQYRLQPLSVPDRAVPAATALTFSAVALFEARARAVVPQFRLDDGSAGWAIALCQTLEGLPLAIELAAWRVGAVRPDGLASAVWQGLDDAAGRVARLPRRHRTLEAALDWSWSLLDAPARRLMRRLAVAVGSIDRELLRDIAAWPDGTDGVQPLPEDPLEAALTTLIERALVTVQPGIGGRLRYRLLDAPRAFARRRLDEAGETEAVRDRHAAAVARRLAREFEARWRPGAHAASWLRRFLPELDEARAALAWAQQRGTLERLGPDLLPTMLLGTPREDGAEIRRLLALAQTLAASLGDRIEAVPVLLECAQCAITLYPDQALQCADAALALDLRLAASGRPTMALRWRHRALCFRAQARLMLCEPFDAAGPPVPAPALQAQADLVEAGALENPSWSAGLRVARALAEIWLADRGQDGPALYAATVRFAALLSEAGFERWKGDREVLNGALAAGHYKEAIRVGRTLVRQVGRTPHRVLLLEARTLLLGALAGGGAASQALELGCADWPQVLEHQRAEDWADFMALALAQGRSGPAGRADGGVLQRLARAPRRAAPPRRGPRGGAGLVPGRCRHRRRASAPVAGGRRP